MDLEVKKWICPGNNPDDAYAVRSAVFVEEQGFSPELEIDDIDPIACHVVLYDGKRPVACARLFADADEPGRYIEGRICVLRELRGRQIGRKLMDLLESKARALGASEAVLGAQRQASGFYAKCGYEPFGEAYMEEHCSHIHMKKVLR